MTTATPWILTALGAYLLGSIPTGYLMMKWGKGLDVRTVGSGNIGMTNVWRAAGWKWGVPVLFLDILKGFLAVSVPQWVLASGSLAPTSPSTAYSVLGGVCVMLGNIFPVFLGFKGGKGVGVGIGIFGTLLPGPTACAIGAFTVTILAFRMISAGSLAGVLTMATAGVWMRGGIDIVSAFGILAAMVVTWTHRSNIRRILSGTENRIGAKVKTAAGKGRRP